MRLLCALALAGLALCSAGNAATVRQTAYKFYPIGGTTPLAINQSILSRGPKYGGVSAYGVTVSNFYKRSRCDNPTGKAARVGAFELQMKFLIKLPKLSTEASLRPDVKTSWRSFERFVRSHEETHRSIYMSCVSKAERKILALKAASCSSLNSKMDAVLDAEKRSCDARHAVFDANEQRRLARQPFMRRVAAEAAGRGQALRAQ